MVPGWLDSVATSSSNLWKVDRVLGVKRLRVGGVQALVRWSGEHPDTWEPLSSFSGDGLGPGVIGLHSKRRRLERLATATLGAILPDTSQRPARMRTQPVRGEAEGEFFRRLVRGTDARVATFRGKRHLVSVATSHRNDGRTDRGDVVLAAPGEVIGQGVGDVAAGRFVSILTEDMNDEIDEERGVATRLAKRKRSTTREDERMPKQLKPAEDPAGSGRRKRRESATLGRGVKQRTA